MDQFAPVNALPVLGQVFPVSPGFHDRIMLCAAHKAFHESRRFVNQFHHFFFFGMLPMSIVKGDKIMEWGIRLNTPAPSSYLKRDYHRQESDCMRGG